MLLLRKTLSSLVKRWYLLVYGLLALIAFWGIRTQQTLVFVGVLIVVTLIARTVLTSGKSGAAQSKLVRRNRFLIRLGLLITLCFGILITIELDQFVQNKAPSRGSQPLGSSINHLAFSHDSNHIVVASEDKQAYVYKTEMNGSAMEPEYHSLAQYTNEIVALAYSNNGRYIAFVDKTSDDSWSIRIWDRQTNSLKRQFRDDRIQGTKNLFFNPAGTQLVSVTSKSEIYFWDLLSDATNNVMAIKEKRIQGTDALLFAFSNDARYFAVANSVMNPKQDNNIYLYRTPTPGDPAGALHLAATLSDHKSQVIAFAFTPVVVDAKTNTVETKLYSLDSAGNLLLNSADKPATPAVAFTLRASNARATAESSHITLALIDPAHKRLFTVNESETSSPQRAKNSIDVWQLSVPIATGQAGISKGATALTRIKPLDSYPQTIQALYAGIGGLTLYVLDKSNNVVVANTDIGNPATGYTPLEIPLATLKDADSIVWNPNLAEFATSHKSHTIQIESLQDKTQNLTLNGQNDGVSLAAFATDDNAIFTVSRDGYVRQWTKNGSILAAEMQWVGTRITVMVVARDGVFLANDHGQVRFWNTENGAFQERLMQPQYISAMALSADEKRLATGYPDGSVQVNDVTDHQDPSHWADIALPTDMKKQKGLITALAFSIQNGAALPNTDPLLASGTADPDIAMRIRVSPINSNENNAVKTFGFKGTRIDLFRLNLETDQLLAAGVADFIGQYQLTHTVNPLDIEGQELPVHSQTVMGLGLRDGKIIAAGPNGNGVAFSEPGGFFDAVRILSPDYFLDILVGSPETRAVWGFAFAGLLGLGLILVPVMAYSGMAADVFLGGTPDLDKGKAARFIRNVRLGRQEFRQEVKAEGVKILTDTENQDLADKMAGPGILYVGEGFAAVIERRGTVVRAVPPGTHFLEAGEKATMRVFLYPRTKIVEIESIWSADHVRVTLMHVSVTHKLLIRNTEDAFKESKRYPMDKSVILNTIWTPERTTSSDWTEGLQRLTTIIATELVAQYPMADLVNAGSLARREVCTQIEKQLKERMALRGVDIDKVEVIRLEVSDKVFTLLQSQSESQLQHQIKIQDADSEHALTIRKNHSDQRGSQFKLALREALVKRLTDTLTVQQGAFADAKVAIRYIQAIESLARETTREEWEEDPGNDERAPEELVETLDRLLEAGERRNPSAGGWNPRPPRRISRGARYRD